MIVVDDDDDDDGDDDGDGSIRSTVVVHWTAGEQVERSYLHQGHDS